MPSGLRSSAFPKEQGLADSDHVPADSGRPGSDGSSTFEPWGVRDCAGDQLSGSRDSTRRCRITAALLGLLVVSACSGSSKPSSHQSSSPSASPSSSSDASAAAGAAALAAYRGFRRAQVAAEAVANAHSRDLAKYAGDKALAQERANLLQLAQAGIVLTGQPILTPKIASVSLGAAPVVTITDCMDTSGWKPIYKASGKSAAAPGQPSRVLATALARPYGQGWLIEELTTDRSRPC